MKRRFVFSATLCALVGMFWTAACFGQGDDAAAIARSYGAIVDDYIEKCRSKSEFLGSESYHMRRLAVRASLKAAYFEAERDQLLADLVAVQSSLNPDRVRYHLNRVFFDAIRGNEIYAEVKVDRQLID